MPNLPVSSFAGLLSLILLCAAPASGQSIPPAQPDRTVTRAERTELIAALGTVLRAKYVLPEVGGRMATHLAERQSTGVYDNTNPKALAELLSSDLYEIARDKHLTVYYRAEPFPSPNGIAQAPPPRAALAARNFYFTKVERLKGNVGYLKFDAFMDPASGAADVAAGAMSFLTSTDALIIDLRENLGGSPEMVAFLCTYFFDGDPIHLNSLYWRSTGQTQQFWTLSVVPGSRYVKKEVYLLTSGQTFSAAEEFSYNLKTQKRATLVGETTRGGANPGGMERLTDHFAAFVPVGRAINPITNTNWEGTGVDPDVKTPADQALDVAYRAALTKLAATSRGPRVDQETKEALDAGKVTP